MGESATIRHRFQADSGQSRCDLPTRSTMEITMKRTPTTRRTGAAPADKLVTKATKNGDVELKEDELKKVSGGVLSSKTDFKYD